MHLEKGKFYELYELDAEIGHKELDWKMTFSGVGKCRQVGISESGIDEAVQKLIARGYKVGRMEQLETSEQAKARGSTSVIQRKLVHVVTPSTACDGNIGPDAVHLLSVKEGNNILENGSVIYGFAFVDCAALKFWIGSISDDASCAALGALLMQVSPKEVIYENQELSKEAQKALKKYSLSGGPPCLGFTALKLTPLPLCTDFVDASKVRNLIHLKGYFKGSDNSWDHALDGVMHHDLALCALGGLLGHLSRLKLDDTYVMEIFYHTKSIAGTLYKYLDNCVTSAGKRLLRNWICHPLKDVQGINNRLNVVEHLMTSTETMSFIAQCLRKLPDLERLLGQGAQVLESSACHHSFRPNLSGHISIRSSLSLSLSFRPSVPVLRAKGENTFQSVESSSENTHRRQLFRRTFPANFSGELSGDGFFYTARSAWRRSPICPKAPEPETHPRAAHARFSGRRLHLTRRRVRAREPLSGDALPPPGSPDADQPPFLPVCAIRALHVPLLGFFCFRGPSDQIFRRPSAIFSQLQSLHVP
ncbi:DNA mismatch repair protein MSH7 [Vitis vinifera]|uniref:DNA mismatch repair protein MSH7 n=1 Tax=Vitis vinifera TaxID=29760 RepID=A0A438EIN4_VITVI|nr:DNA mismatch repair protein MSH7 [Vitis vinifera]